MKFLESDQRDVFKTLNKPEENQKRILEFVTKLRDNRFKQIELEKKVNGLDVVQEESEEIPSEGKGKADEMTSTEQS